MVPILPVAKYCFIFKMQTPTHPPPFSDIVWHRVFGLSLHKLTCIQPSATCGGCGLRGQCPYAFLFKGVRPKSAVMMRKYQTVPVPHVFRIDRSDQKPIPAGGKFSIEMVLVGRAVEKLPLVVRALAAAADKGIGSSRSRANLHAVMRNFPDNPPSLLMPDGQISNRSVSKTPTVPPMPKALRIQLRTPYLFSNKQKSENRIDVSRFCMAIVRRISLLQYFSTGRPLDADFKQLKTLANGLHPLHTRFAPYKRSQFDRKQKSRIPLHGLEGYVDLDMAGMDALWPYLYIGQWLQVGKKASAGFGRYQLFAHAA